MLAKRILAARPRGSVAVPWQFMARDLYHVMRVTLRRSQYSHSDYMQISAQQKASNKPRQYGDENS